MTDPREDLPSSSSMPRYFGCDGAYMAEKAVADTIKKDSKDALAGRRTHKLINNPPEEFDSQGEEYTVQRSLELRQEAIEKCGLHEAEDAQIIKDERIWLRGSKLEKIFSGEYDFATISRSLDLGLLYDDKTLYGDHGEAKSNEQLISYAVLFRYKYGVSNVVIALGQPNLPYHRQLTMCRFNETTLMLAEKRLRAKLEYIKQEGLKRKFNKHCGFCDAAHVCEHSQNESFEIAFTEHEIQHVTTPDILDRISTAKAVLGRIEEVEKAKAMVQINEDPMSFPGWHVANGRKTVTVDTKQAWEILKGDLVAQEFRKACTLSLSQLTLPYKIAMNISSQKKARVELEIRLANHIEITHGEAFVQRG